MKNPPNLMLRGMTYYVRLYVPEGLQKHYGKKEIWRSLKTRDRSEALKILRIELLRFDQECAEREREQSPEPAVTDMTEIERKVELYFYQLLKWDDERRLQGYRENELKKLEKNSKKDLKDFKQGNRLNSETIVEPEVEEFLFLHPEIKIKKGTTDYKRLLRVIYRTNIRNHEILQARNRGDIAETPVIAPAKPKSIKLTEAYELWRINHKGPKKTAEEFLAHINKFISFFSDLPIDQITNEHISDYQDALLRFPSKLTNAERKLGVREILKRYESADVPRLKPQTINEKYLGALKAILTLSVKKKIITINPAIGIRANEEKVIEPPVVLLTDAEIKTVLEFPVFSIGERPIAGAGEAAKWLPLLAMFTGARLEELAALKVENIKTEEGVLYLHIRGRIKNQSSLRKVPVHSQLLELGFAKYIQTIKNGPLFPLLDWEKETVSESWSKWWTRYRREHGITDERKKFHSFRHTVKRKFRDAKVPKELRDALMGHAAKDVAESNYGLDEEGTGYSLIVLKEALEKINFPALDGPNPVVIK